MLRKVALSILILLSVIAVMPFADSAARGLGRSVGLHMRHHRRHSRRWWRRHRAHMRSRQAAQAMAHRPATLMAKPVVADPVMTPGMTPTAAIAVPTASNSWNALPASANGELKFRAKENATDQAALTVVALSRPAPAYLTSKEQRQMLSGVSFAELRRSVIDKMITAGGWVSNDFEREVGGHRVFIVTAQTPAEGRTPEKSWNFYFTEVNGRIYSLSTEASLQSAQRMAAEAEKFIASLH